MPARPGTREEITDELRAVLYRAFTQDPTLTYEKLADLIAQQNPGLDRPHPTSLKRIIDPADPKPSGSSSILWAIKRALGVPETDDWRVTFKREEIDLLDDWSTLRSVNEEAALAILADVRRRAALARAAIEARRKAGEGLPAVAETDTPETKTPAPER